MNRFQQSLAVSIVLAITLAIGSMAVRTSGGCRCVGAVAANGGAEFGEDNAIWETWADDSLTFPSSPNPAQAPTGGRAATGR